MADVLEMGTLFTPELVTELFSTVRGKSSIAALSGQKPIPFTGNTEMTFAMDDEIALVGEGEKKSAGSMNLTPVTIVPVKVEYGTRVSDEFLYASEEKRLDILGSFNDGFAKKLARGLDIIAIHGINPRTGQESSLIKSSFKDIVNVIEYDASTADDNLQEAIDTIEDYEITGIALSRKFAAAMAKIKANGVRLYPEFAFGAQAASFYGTACSVNNTVNFANGLHGLVGDFDAFKWGFAKEIPLEVIPYGDPDGSGKDLKAYNQVYLRSEAYLGCAILDINAFCKIAENTAGPTSAKKA